MSKDRKQSHRYTDDDVIDAVRSQKHATAKNVSETLECSKQAAQFRLNNLEDEGRIERERIGNTYVYTVVEGEETE